MPAACGRRARAIGIIPPCGICWRARWWGDAETKAEADAIQARARNQAPRRRRDTAQRRPRLQSQPGDDFEAFAMKPPIFSPPPAGSKPQQYLHLARMF